MLCSYLKIAASKEVVKVAAEDASSEWFTEPEKWGFETASSRADNDFLSRMAVLRVCGTSS